jgi:hypothetical protein
MSDRLRVNSNSLVQDWSHSAAQDSTSQSHLGIGIAEQAAANSHASQGHMGALRGLGAPTRAPMPQLTPDQLASGLQQLSVGPGIRHRPAPPALDRRGNNVEATRRESRWATQVWKQLTPEQAGLFVDHLYQLVDAGRYYRQELVKILPRMDKTEAAESMARFRHVDEVEKSLDEWMRSGGSGSELAERLLDKRDFKNLLDLVGKLQETMDPVLRNRIRAQPFFTDRGRQLMPEDQVRESSLMNRHAGIADGLHRRRSTENFFSKDIEHAKADYERIPSSDTSRRFSRGGTPFVGGISGSAQFIVQHMEMQCPFRERPLPERQQMEQLLLMHAALMTAGGHHSIMETLLPGRMLGYFADLPDPLRSRDGYDVCMTALDARLRQMGMSAQIRLSPA